MNALLGTLGMEATTDRGDMIMTTTLPAFTQAGECGDWTFTDRYGSTTDLDGDFLGMGSSHRPFHKHSFPPYAEPRQHCSTCRWMEVRIFQEVRSDDASRRYLVVRTGQTIVPGEERRTTFGYLDTAADLVNALVTWEEGRGRLGYVERRALEQAASYDRDLQSAYDAARDGGVE